MATNDDSRGPATEDGRYARVINAIEDGVSIVSADYELEFVNHVLIDEFGPAEGRKCYQFFLDRPDPCPWCNNKEVFSGQTVRYEWSSGKSGHTYELVDSPLHNSDGSISKLEIFRDITERRNLEEQLRTAQKMEAIGRLAGGVAHDFNNILAVILSNARFVREALSDGTEAMDDLAEIEAASHRAAGLVRQLLAFSRQQVLHPIDLDLNDVVTGVKQMLERVIGEDIELRTQLDPRLHTLRADPGQMEQVLLNLALNARDAMPRGGSLTIETANIHLDDLYGAGQGPLSGPGIMLSVIDTGTGMSDETRSRVFEPFYTTKGLAEGTGLGLATVYGIATQLGGDARVESELGKGAAFRLCFPAQVSAIPTPLARRPRADSVPPPGGETILVVEDEDAVRRAACRVLKRLGHKVLEARNGDEAVHICTRYPGPIHLVLADVIMPGLSGPETFERLLESRATLRVAYMSGYAGDILAQHQAVMKNAVFIEKPFQPKTLVKGIREALERTPSQPPPPPD